MPDAESKLRIVHDQLGGKEMQVGRFYLQKRNYIAGINRFKTVVVDYQTTRHVEEALFRLTEGLLRARCRQRSADRCGRART